MSGNDNQGRRDIGQIVADMEGAVPPPPSADARARAMAAAIDAFDQERQQVTHAGAESGRPNLFEKIFQGNRQGRRLRGIASASDASQKGREPQTMTTITSPQYWINNPWRMSTAIATVTAIIAVPVVLAVKDQRSEQRLISAQLPEIVMAPQRAPAASAAEASSVNRAALSFADMVAAEPSPIAPGHRDFGRDVFEEITQNPVKLTREEPVSTFSIDVDTASYSFMRRQLSQGVLPRPDAIRVEELINYFDYDYALPEDPAQPFEPTVAVYPSPWNAGNQLLHIGIKGHDLSPEARPGSNLVFLVDRSSSMNGPDRLQLLQQSLKLLLDGLAPDDTVAIVAYAGASGTVLEPTPVSDRRAIERAIDALTAGGSTAGGEGIRQAYALARASFDEDKVNRVILATDGDFNVGITDQEELKGFIERERESGIFLSVLGFGQGNYNDALMQTLAQNGNGNAAYIDTLSEARKVLVDEASSTLFPIANDVKIQIEFNPAQVLEYRLIGYETRLLNREDFNNDAVDAGEIGAGHEVTAIYELTPTGSEAALVDGLRYSDAASDSRATAPGGRDVPAAQGRAAEIGFLKMRYKLPGEDTSRLITRAIGPEDVAGDVMDLPADIRFATAVAGFGQLLTGGRFTGDFGYRDVVDLANSAKGSDPYGYRAEFVQLVRAAQSAASLAPQPPGLQPNFVPRAE